MDLFISPGCPGLLTADSNSLLILTYIRLGEFRVNLNDSVPHDLSLDNVPLLHHGGIETTGVKNILAYLRSQNYGLEYVLTDYENVELTSIVSIIERHLTPAVNWFLWADDGVYRLFTRSCYTNRLRWPFSFVFPFYWRRLQTERAERSQLCHCTHPVVREDVQTELYALAKRCLTSLSYILGKNDYLVGNKPTAADAYLFARLWPLLLYECRHGYAEWPAIGSSQTCSQTGSHPLITHVLQCSNLVAFFSRIQKQCFPNDAVYFRQERVNATLKRQQTGLFSTHPVRDCVLLGTGLACLFLFYAKKIGFIRILS